MLGQTKVSICSFPLYAFPGVSTWKKNSLVIVSESQEEQPDKDEPDRTCEACLDDLLLRVIDALSLPQLVITIAAHASFA